MKFEITDLRNSTVWNLYRMRDRIQIEPAYQRMGDIWPIDKRQLLIDSILNEFDIPKFYLHKFSTPLKKSGKVYDFAIIDGKQRLETIWGFIDGLLSVPKDFEYFRDLGIDAGGMTYSELGKEHPDLKVQFDSYALSVVCIETDELEMVEEMFSRLNESAPLAAPEKRNALGGPIPGASRRLAAEPFFKTNLPFSNKRYRHFDLATKFLQADATRKVSDTKKIYLDEFVRHYKDQDRNRMPAFLKTSKSTVGRMADVFSEKDPLLRQVGMVIVYYHLFRIAHDQGWSERISRAKLVRFEDLRAKNRKVAETSIADASYDLLEFDRYTQSPNDGYAIKFRLSVMMREVFNKTIAVEKL